MDNNAVLVVGAGLAGMTASLILANAGKKVYLVEKELYIGGNTIKYEEVFSNLECSTCLVSPTQQEVLQHENIEVLTLSEVRDVQGTCGNFVVTIEKKARYVSLEECIGCDECFEPCPISVPNEYEQGLSQRKAIYTPCAGTLPNVPRIDPENCLRFKGEDCQACQEACMFEAIDFDQQDEELEVRVDAIILATGFIPLKPQSIPQYGYGLDDVYPAFAFERLYASNGPTGGEILLKNGDTPGSAAVIWAVGIKDILCPPSICTMYALKFVHYLKEKLPEIEVTEFYKGICAPGKSYQKFLAKIRKYGSHLVKAVDINVNEHNGQKMVTYITEAEGEQHLTVDMVIFATPLRPQDDAAKVAETFGIPLSDSGFFAKEQHELSSVITPKKGIFIAGCATGPKDIQGSVIQSQAAAGRVLALYYEEVN